MEKYNGKRMQELLIQSGRSRAAFRKGMGGLDDRIAKNYLAGGDLLVSKLLRVCEFFGVSVAEFFERDGVRFDQLMQGTYVAPKQQETLPVSESEALAQERREHQLEMRHMEEQMQLRIQYERKLAALERENTLLREELKKRDGGAAHHPALYVEDKNGNDYYPSLVAEEEKGL